MAERGKIVFTFAQLKSNLPLMTTLFGVYESTVDAKGRVMLPNPFKKQLAKVLDNGFVIKASIFSKSLELYPMAAWNESANEVKKVSRFSKDDTDFVRMFNFGIRPADLDASARFLITKEQMDFAGIKKDIVIASANDYLEIWDKKAYHKFITDNRERFEKLTEKVMGRIKQEGDGK